tara:strand:- start:213 stop:440 length:228 start_codon:yes stop_codon:yes gene_type:complete
MNNTIKKTFAVLIAFIVLASAFFGYDSLFGFVSNNGIGREALAAALGALFVVLAPQWTKLLPEDVASRDEVYSFR